jgi:hypothetical protein
MNNGKPKGKTPSLIGSSLGRPRKTTVERSSKCKRCSGELTKGLECYEIPHLGGSFANYKRYCDMCFHGILMQTKVELDILIQGHQIRSAQVSS